MEIVDVARWGVAGLYAILLAIAAVTDVKERRIPNWTVLGLIGLFVPWIFVGPDVDILSALAAFAIALAAGVALWAFKIMGAGDSKMFAAVALFAGMKLLAYFALGTVLIGGVFALAALAMDPRCALLVWSTKGKVGGRGIPYGAPIAIAGLIIMFATPFGAIHDTSISGQTGGALLEALPSK